MDSQDYLDQISREAKPKARPKNGFANFLKSGYFKWGSIATGVLLVIILLGAILGNRGESVQDKCVKLKFRLDQTNTVITEYQQFVKSSSLRSLSASLKGAFTNTSSQLLNFLSSAYGFEENKVDDAIIEEAELNADELSSEMFEAKINGLLDRTYAHKMALEIYSVMSEEAGIYNSTDQAALKEILQSSRDSLNNLYTQFNDFSETK